MPPSSSGTFRAIHQTKPMVCLATSSASGVEHRRRAINEQHEEPRRSLSALINYRYTFEASTTATEQQDSVFFFDHLFVEGLCRRTQLCIQTLAMPARNWTKRQKHTENMHKVTLGAESMHLLVTVNSQSRFASMLGCCTGKQTGSVENTT